MGRPPTRRREEILDAAIKLLRTEGERAMTQTRVAKEAGIPQGHLTYYFPKKRDLVLGVAARFAEITGERMVAFFQARREQPIGEVLRDYTQQVAGDRERTRMVLALLVMSEAEPELGRVLEQNAGALRAMLAPVINRNLDDPVVDLMLALVWGVGLHEFVLRKGITGELVALGFALTNKKSAAEPSST